MKLTTAIILFLIISNIAISLQSRFTLSSRRYQRRRVHNNASKTQGPGNNKWYNLAMGVIGELAGGQHEQIQSCLPDDWKTDNGSPDEGEAAPVSSSSNVFEKIMKVVGPIIGFFCKVKNFVKKMLGLGLIRRYKLTRAFIMRKFMNSGFFKKIFGGIKKVASKIGGGIVKAAKAVGKGVVTVVKKVGEGVKWVIEQAKKAVLAVINKIKEWFHKLVDKIKSIFNSPIIKKILHLFECIKGLVGPAQELISVVKGIVMKVRNIIAGGLVGLISILIDLVCNWKEFKAAVEFLIAGIKEKDTVRKFNLIGKFIGKLLYAIAKARRLRKYYYKMKILRMRLH